MPNESGNLHIFEAIELRSSYDREIDLLEKLTQSETSARDRLYARSGDEEEKEPADGFDLKELEIALKKLKTKRLKLNQAIQRANFEVQIEYKGEQVPLMQALEIRKNLLADLAACSQRVQNSAYKRIIHKEERDIVHNPRHSFQAVYGEYKTALGELRSVIEKIHVANHTHAVNFRDD